MTTVVEPWIPNTQRLPGTGMTAVIVRYDRIVVVHDVLALAK